ncbi:hypothetical protein ZOSMA_10G00900 [Zostera marina]|uniref:Mitochondrial transcription termination factor family protein n=1 Tax=Zostera marina TaxID=29655 RepID=A0A0K9Q5L8_ZOSMR|nr:hypothetical protein ZOSMA_10G00900 [Zostera marina]
MSERVKFLRSLGLTIADINNYPLVLGCSVPVLDLLSKLGARKSIFTEFLRRYPQVLHASVVVDLVPVVKYLQGMDVKPCDIPKVLERLYLICQIEPENRHLLESIILVGFEPEDFGRIKEKMPQIVSLARAPMVKHVAFLQGCGFSMKQVKEMVVGCPHLLALNLDIMKRSFKYFHEEMERDLEDLIQRYQARYRSVTRCENRTENPVQQTVGSRGGRTARPPCTNLH